MGDARQPRLAAVADAVGVARMVVVQRQELGWQREASVAAGNGNSVEALARYDAKNRIVYAADAGDAMKRLGDAWEANRKAHPGASRLVLAGRNAEVHALNAELRSRAMAAGELGAEAVTLRTVHAGGRRGGRGEVREMEVRARHRVAVGVTLTRSGRDVLANDAATVRGFTRGRDPTLVLRLDRTGEEVALRASDLAPPARKGQEAEPRAPVLQHAYARTIHKSQGWTVDCALVHGGAGLDAARAYVAMTRHRRDAVLFADGARSADASRPTAGSRTPKRCGKPSSARRAARPAASTPGISSPTAPHGSGRATTAPSRTRLA